MDVLGHMELELDILTALLVLGDSRQQIVVGMQMSLAEGHLDDQVAVGHEAHELVGLGVSGQIVGLLEFLDGEVLALVLDFLASAHDQLVANDLGLHRLGHVSDAVHCDSTTTTTTTTKITNVS